MSNYNYICDNCGDIILNSQLGTAKEIEICPKCGQEITRSYSATTSIWKCDGAYNQTRGN